MKDIFPIGPNDKTVVVDEDNMVLFTDYPPMKAPPLAGKLTRKEPSLEKPHLLDIIEAKDQDVLRLIGIAIDRPGQIVECDTTFRSERKRVRVLHADLNGNQKRTHIVFEPLNK